ncbi:phage minor capsid protein [Halobacillus naozhouensis]|uniref:Phage minor capsid protein 2 n=1 Tax=Halobacillus naozhouensis TaxID=554880 RepID=A0ABY8J3R0_9BACI|nr:phage minor capsid protein [Halobacillus naozhouensis]WFT76234.1 hypothetical protein P9989_07690 [Halobacillus naozhouensis]
MNNKILKYISNVVQRIIGLVAEARDLGDEKKAQSLIDEVTGILDQFGLEMEVVIPKAVIENYFGGVDQATKLMSQAGLEVNQTLTLTKSGQVAKGFQKKIHMEALEQIADDTLLDFKAAIRTAKKSSKASITGALESVKRDLAEGYIAGNTRKVINKRVADSFAENGLTAFTTVDGRNLPLDFYASTVTKTKMKEANVKGSTNRYTESGVNLVQISTHYPTCHECARYQGLVVSLTGEHDGFPSIVADIALPPYHPNCSHGISPYVLEFKTEQEIGEAKSRWQNFKPEKDTRSATQKREYNKEQDARRRANEEKKQYARWQMVLGKGAPATLGAFRRMKRQNTAKFQELQSEYRSIAQEVVRDRSQ